MDIGSGNFVHFILCSCKLSNCQVPGSKLWIGPSHFYFPNLEKSSFRAISLRWQIFVHISQMENRKSGSSQPRGPFLESPEKPLVKLWPAYYVKRVFSYVVKGIKIEITPKVRASERLRFEDTKRIMSLEMRPKSFGTFQPRSQGLSSSLHSPRKGRKRDPGNEAGDFRETAPRPSPARLVITCYIRSQSTLGF